MKDKLTPLLEGLNYIAQAEGNKNRFKIVKVLYDRNIEHAVYFGDYKVCRVVLEFMPEHKELCKDGDIKTLYRTFLNYLVFALKDEESGIIPINELIINDDTV